MSVAKKKNYRVVLARSKPGKKRGLAESSGDARLKRALLKWRKKVRPLLEAARSSEQLSEKDLAIRINARG